MIGAPTFPEDELARLKRETVAEIVESRDNDRSLAQHFFRRTLFDGHPYGRSSLGTTRAIERVEATDVRAFHAKHFLRGNVVIGFAGDVTEKSARALGAALVAALRGGARVADAVGEPRPLSGRRLVLVDKPERTQTQILVGATRHVAARRRSRRARRRQRRLRRHLHVAPHEGVRSERGWSYGAYARLAIDRQRQAFSMWTFPAATDAAPCVALELELLEKWVDEGITKGEAAFIKAYLIRSQAFEVDTAPKRLHQAIDVEVLGLPADYHSGYVEPRRARHRGRGQRRGEAARRDRRPALHGRRHGERRARADRGGDARASRRRPWSRSTSRSDVASDQGCEVIPSGARDVA